MYIWAINNGVDINGTSDVEEAAVGIEQLASAAKCARAAAKSAWRAVWPYAQTRDGREQPASVPDVFSKRVKIVA